METRDNIEDLIRQNLEELNENEPRNGHFERFEVKLKAQNRKKPTFNIVWKVAAAVIFVLLAGNQVAIYFSDSGQGFIPTKNNATEMSLASVSPEYKEVEFYFTNAINVGLNQWQNMENEGLVSESEQKMMDTELQDFEARYKDLQSDLAANPNDERVINAMLEYYRTKLSIINLIVNKLEEVKQHKNNSHETEI